MTMRDISRRLERLDAHCTVAHRRVVTVVREGDEPVATAIAVVRGAPLRTAASR
jgi:hypothetical protein